MQKWSSGVEGGGQVRPQRAIPPQLPKPRRRRLFWRPPFPHVAQSARRADRPERPCPARVSRRHGFAVEPAAAAAHEAASGPAGRLADPVPAGPRHRGGAPKPHLFPSRIPRSPFPPLPTAPRPLTAPSPSRREGAPRAPTTRASTHSYTAPRTRGPDGAGRSNRIDSEWAARPECVCKRP